MEQVRKEFELRGKEKNNTVLHDFLKNSEDQLRRLKSDERIANEAFHTCVEFFGESTIQVDANTFFSLLVRFARAFKVCVLHLVYLFILILFFNLLIFIIQAADQENERRRRLEAAAVEAFNTSEEVIKRNKLNQKKQQVCYTFLKQNKTQFFVSNLHRILHALTLLRQPIN